MVTENNTTHGEALRGPKCPEYETWTGMIRRCENDNFKQFADWGGRGIRVCERWRHGEGVVTGYECFLADMGRRPSNKHSIDRWPNNDGNYEPTNCRWATRAEQSANKRAPNGKSVASTRVLGSI